MVHGPYKNKGGNRGKSGKLRIVKCLVNVHDFSLYGSWEALDSVKTLSQGAQTFSTRGKPILRIFKNQYFGLPRPRDGPDPGPGLGP